MLISTPINAASNENTRFLQSDFWVEFKCKHGWRSMKFESKDNESGVSFCVNVLVRKIAKVFSIAYVPMAPEIEGCAFSDYYSVLLDFAKSIKNYLPKNTLCVRFDPPVDFDNPEERSVAQKNVSPLKKSRTDIQPPDTVLLDITQSEETLLANMKSKWRYNVHLAEKKEVVVIKGTSRDVDIFYDLYKETSKRDGIALHSKEYYKSLLEQSESSPNAPLVTLYIAKNEDDFLAAIITLFCKREAVYLYGASSNTKRNLMPAYLLQWTAIQDAKKYGAPVYDFYGIPPTDDETHPMHGLYRFKTGFGGKNVHRIGSLDAPLSSFYGAYITLEKIRAFWYKKLKKVLAGRK